MHLDRTASSAASGELASLAILTEVVGSLKFTGTLELVACLLETLNKVTINISPDVVDRRFVEQLLMSAIENAVENLPVCAIPHTLVLTVADQIRSPPQLWPPGRFE